MPSYIYIYIYMRPSYLGSIRTAQRKTPLKVIISVEEVKVK